MFRAEMSGYGVLVSGTCRHGCLLGFLGSSPSRCQVPLSLYHPLNNSRPNQSRIVTPTTTVATMSRARSVGTPPNQRPTAAEATNQGATAIASAPTSSPPAFASAALASCPRVRCAQEVVIPHEGQRRPITMTRVQGGRPSWRCVPKPSGLGCSNLAVSSSPSRTSPPASARARLIGSNRPLGLDVAPLTLSPGKVAAGR